MQSFVPLDNYQLSVSLDRITHPTPLIRDFPMRPVEFGLATYEAYCLKWSSASPRVLD